MGVVRTSPLRAVVCALGAIVGGYVVGAIVFISYMGHLVLTSDDEGMHNLWRDDAGAGLKAATKHVAPLGTHGSRLTPTNAPTSDCT